MRSGILCIDKPAEHTSFDVVARMRGIAKTKKIGHGGTLDPMATGVLPLFFERATKACGLLPDQDKHYRATFQLGVITDTQDITGTVLEQRPVAVKKDRVAEALHGFVGTQMQLPPMYSAVWVDGQRLYDLARKGIEVERPSREITVFELELVDCNEDAGLYTIEISCSKGAYIRTICHDIGMRLGCGAVMTALRRTKACGYTLEHCITLERAQQLAQGGTLEEHILPIDSAFTHLPVLTLNDKLAGHFCNGVPLSLNQFSSPPRERCRIYREDGVFLGMAQPDQEGMRYRIVALFYSHL